MAPIVVGYWNIRGRGEPIRILLKYVNVEFTDQRYSFGDGDRKSEWFEVKPTLGLDFPNLPYLIDGDVKLTQSLAILRYLARKYKLDGKSEQEKQKIDLLEQQVLDISTDYIKFIHKREPSDEQRSAFLADLDKDLTLLSKYLAESHFVAGENISFVDFYLYEYLHWIETSKIANDKLHQFSNLKQFVERIEALPQLADYLAQLKADKL